MQNNCISKLFILIVNVTKLVYNITMFLKKHVFLDSLIFIFI